MILDIVIITLGLICSFLLFYRLPSLPSGEKITFPHKISVIIPARNEEKNLPLLLQDLKMQTAELFEIICVDDGSEDNTAAIASSYGAKLISLQDVPAMWTGKSWACQNGADASTGDILIFLDADVRLSPDGIARLIHAHAEQSSVISVEPYHRMLRRYEYGSLFFNLIQIAANGLGLPLKNHNIGLYGPVILIRKSDYVAVGGHKSIRSSIVDDVALGEELRNSGIPFSLYMGDRDISFRMYGSGPRSLLQGWTKNLATGASKTRIDVFVMAFLWVTSCLSVPVQWTISMVNMDMLPIVLYSVFYVVWVFELRRIARRVGNFPFYTMLLYPAYLLVFTGVFILSLLKKIFHRKVIWKDRKIEARK
jgi:4,4'-diaponeurosporenoate glycosyltransferase